MSVITIKILGTTAGVPTKTRAHASIYLQYDDGDEFACLMDCGEGTQRQMLVSGIGIMKINDIFISHWHGDHCLGLPGLLDTMGFEGRTSPVDIYAPDAGRAYKCRNFINYSMGKVKVRPHNVPSRGARMTTLLDEGRFKIVSIPVKHGIPAVAFAFIEKDKVCIDIEKASKRGLPEKGELYRDLKNNGKVDTASGTVFLEEVSFVKKGKKIVYSGDTEVCENLASLSLDADILIQDCTYFEDVSKERPHMHASFGEVMKMAAESRVKKTILTHISRKYSQEEIEKMVSGYDGVVPAEDFFEIKV